MDQDLRAQAADPATSPSTLHLLAAEHPELWATLATNPALYPDLRQWLAGTGDPEVLSALQAGPDAVSVQVEAENSPAAEEVVAEVEAAIPEERAVQESVLEEVSTDAVASEMTDAEVGVWGEGPVEAELLSEPSAKAVVSEEIIPEPVAPEPVATEAVILDEPTVEMVAAENPAPYSEAETVAIPEIPFPEVPVPEPAIPILPPPTGVPPASQYQVPPIPHAPIPVPSLAATEKPNYLTLVLWIILVAILVIAAVVLGVFLLQRSSELAQPLIQLSSQVGEAVA